MKTLQHLMEMAKRASPDQFYGFGKTMYGAEKVKALTWPEIKAIADKHDVLIPAYLRSQKVGRGRFNIVPAEHADAKAPAKVEPKAEPKPTPKEEPKAEKKYERPQLENTYYTEWSEFYQAMKKAFGDIEIQRVPHGPQRVGRHGVEIGEKLIVNKKTDKVIGTWEVTGGDMVPGRGFVAYGQGYVAKVKQEASKAAPAPKKERESGKASEQEMKVALADAKAEMRSAHQMARYCTWGQTEQHGKRFEFDVRDWGDWEVPEGEEDDGDYDWKVMTKKSREYLTDIIRAVEKRHPKVKLSYSPEEKNWIRIIAE